MNFAALFANPSGGTVSTGSAAISQSSSGKTTIDQKSEGVVIDWSSFNVGNGQTTQFVQPNASAIAVNRIGGASASQILGTLDANGRIILINGNGLLFGKGASVNVGSLIATSTDDTDSNVLAGTFSKAGSQNAAVVSQGRISTSNGGVVALVAPSVTNAGIVNAKLGTVALGAANKFTVDFSGDGLVSFAAQGDVTGAAKAINTGRLSGANVSMTAHAAEGLATGVVNMSGTITAQSVHQAGGVIVLDAGSGTLTTMGTLNAAGTAGGGTIETSGNSAAISGYITAGAGGNWLVDPDNLTIKAAAAKTIDASLQAGTSVELQTTASGTGGPGIVSAGEGDIDIAKQIVWSTSARLTIDAYHSINVLAPIKIEGAGTLSLTSNTEGTDGVLSFNGGYAAFSDVVGGTTQGALLINGNSYTLENNLHSLAAGIAANPSGHFALADSYNAKADGTYVSSPIKTVFLGTFDGLGNKLSDVSINDPTDLNVGLFATNSGTILNAVLDDVKIIALGTQSENGYLSVGGLVGQNNGMIAASSVDGSISGKYAFDGLLVGTNHGTILGSHTSGSIRGADDSNGGLVGHNQTENTNLLGLISLSYSSAEISALKGTSAGFVAQNEGTITTSYATGSVIGKAGGFAGGFAGQTGYGGTISLSYATGAVELLGQYGEVGGFAGFNDWDGTIENSYSTGSVFGSGKGSDVGGFVGANGHEGEGESFFISSSYSTGAVSGAHGAILGGFAGSDQSSGGISSCYWDTATSGIANLSQGAGNLANDPGITGLTTAQLQSGLPAGFSAADWGLSASANGGLPYLLAIPPS